MRVVADACKGKSTPEKNEDGWFRSDHFIAVIDGSTAAGEINGKPGGVVAKDSILETLDMLPPTATFAMFREWANENIRHHAQSALIPPFAAVKVLSEHRRELWTIGDCAHRIDNEPWDIYPNFPHEVEMYAARKHAIATMKEPRTPENIRVLSAKITKPYVDGVKHWVNHPTHPFRHPMLNGHPIPEDLLQPIVHVPAGAHSIYLATDGALVSPYGQRGPTDFADMWEQIETLRRKDPECLHLFDYWRGFNPGTTLLDDTTMVRVDLTR